MNKRVQRINLFYLLKTGFGSAIAILIAETIGLAYSPSAGIITLLTIQNTKKETITIALKRIAAFCLAVAIAFVIFSTIGYSPVTFGLFVFLFVAFCILLELKDGIAMNAVLTTHFLIEKKFDFDLLMNEVAILFIGMGIGVMVNLIMPKYKERIRREQLLLEQEIKKLLRGMAKLLQDKDACLVQGGNVVEKTGEALSHEEAVIIPKQSELVEKDFNRIEHMLDKLLRKAYEDAGNTLLSDTKYLVSYLEMRKLQLNVLKGIRDKMLSIPVLLRQSYPIVTFIEHIADSFHELNNAEGLLKELQGLYEHFRGEALPGSREEFEYRSILFQILKEIEYFLILKQNFMKELDASDIKSYWAK